MAAQISNGIFTPSSDTINRDKDLSHKENSFHMSTPLRLPYIVLSTGLGFPNEDQKFWWYAFAPTIQDLMIECNYDITHQYQYLALIYRYILPALGPRAHPGEKPHWESFLTDDCSPVESSINLHGGKATVRMCFEPVGKLAGTEHDPFNWFASREFIRSMEEFPDVTNLQWFRHFERELIASPDHATRIRKLLPANEHRDGQAMLKAYFFPMLKSLETGKSEARLVFDSALKLDSEQYPIAPALSMVEAYVASCPPEENARVEFLSIDCNDPDESRIKIYFRTPCTSFNKVREVYTLGGRLKDETTRAGLDILKELWPLLLNSWPSIQRIAGVLFNFETTPGKIYPEPKLYIPVKHHAKSDIAIAGGLSSCFHRQGWTDLAKSYTEGLRARL
ncbi:hypothetical protein VTN00DRAFT_3090 [Thermoascus crustaceus]|uniref:uncharacterized protein n=1 Tax=Thermoascus crustaceus TaxID=5088 RepID=UPI0037430775